MHPIRERWAYSQTPRAPGVVGSFTCPSRSAPSRRDIRIRQHFMEGSFAPSYAFWPKASALAWTMACTDPRLSDRHRTECRTAHRPCLVKAKNRFGFGRFQKNKVRYSLTSTPFGAHSIFLYKLPPTTRLLVLNWPIGIISLKKSLLGNNPLRHVMESAGAGRRSASGTLRATAGELLQPDTTARRFRRQRLHRALERPMHGRLERRHNPHRRPFRDPDRRFGAHRAS